jgi:D-threo-aldose 1-dehydrogenase
LYLRLRHVRQAPTASQVAPRNVKFVIGSSLNAGFISGNPRYNYGKISWDIPREYIKKREKLPHFSAAVYGMSDA